MRYRTNLPTDDDDWAPVDFDPDIVPIGLRARTEAHVDANACTAAHQQPAYSSWPGAIPGPLPRPEWVITDGNAVDTELGVVKTGKEADVHLVQRAVSDTALAPGATVLMAAKRYRGTEHRLFHRDIGYQEGRRVRRSRENRAMARRTTFGREMLSGQWAWAEFNALATLWQLGAPVPYPVQLLGTELMLEFIGDGDANAAPRLAAVRPRHPDDLYGQCRAAMRILASNGWAHGDLSAYNLLVQDGRLVMIDLPQIVDVVANPQGPAFLRRDCRNVCAYFTSRGLDPDADELFAELLDLATNR